MFNKYLEKTTINKRKGVITKVKIPKRVPICEIRGPIYTEEQIDTFTTDKTANCLQIGPNLYIGPNGSLTDSIRHSCSPNCVLHISGTRAILYSLYVIKPGAELTYDYSSSSTDTYETWNMNCTCGSYTCRKNISGFFTLPTQLQEEYKQKEIAALFIRVPIFTRK